MARWALLLLICLATAAAAAAQVLGTIKLIVRDQQNLAVSSAEAIIKAKTSAWSQTSKTNDQGETVFPAVPVGEYVITVEAPGFVTSQKELVVVSNAVTPVQFQLAVAA